jgi:hypothetical protein
VKLENCKTVADLIDLLIEIRAEPIPSDNHWRRELEVESHIQTTLLAYGGPAVWRGRLWWTQERPRDGLVNDVPVYNAAELPWPVEIKAQDMTDASSLDRKFEKAYPPTIGDVHAAKPVGSIIPTVWGDVPPEKVIGPFPEHKE